MEGIFKDLKPFEKAEYIIMLMLAAAIPLHWFAAQVGEAALLVCAAAKIVFEQKFQLNREQLKYKWVYIIYALTWLIYLIGMLYTENQWFGWIQVSKKLGFLIFPTIFLFSDMSYLTKKRVTAIGYALIAGCLLFFFIQLSLAFYDLIFNGCTSDRFFDEELMKVIPVQHSYMSMYACLCLMFCFVEFFENKSRKAKIINLLAYFTFVVMIILLSSRAGLIWMVMTFIIQWAWLTFIMKKRVLGIIVGCLFVVMIIGSWLLFPQSAERIKLTIMKLTTENQSDHRLTQFKGYKEVIDENWLFGVGTGDRCDEMEISYMRYKEEIIEKIGPEVAGEIDKYIKKEWYEPWETMRENIMKKAEEYGRDPDMVNSYIIDYMYICYAIDKETNAHNMFIETLISVGVVGVMLLLAYFVLPIVLWIRQKRFDIFFFTFLMMVFFNAMFESVFERQLGIIFFCFFNSLMFYMSFISKPDKNNQ